MVRVADFTWGSPTSTAGGFASLLRPVQTDAAGCNPYNLRQPMTKKASPESAAQPAVNPAQLPPPNFEAALAELEQLTDALETGQTSLDELLEGYRRAAFLLQFCRGQLQAVENQVKVMDSAMTRADSGGSA